MHGTTKPAQSIDSRDWLLLVLLSVLWGGSFLFIGTAIRELPPLTIVALRVCLATLVLLPIALLRGVSIPKDWDGWRPFVIMAVLNNIIPFSMQAISLQYITSGLASVLNAMTPLCTVLVMAAFGEERLVARRVAGVVLGLLGVVILRHGFDIASSQSIGILVCLAATISYGFSALWAKRHLAGKPPLGLAVCQLLMSSWMMGLLALMVDHPWRLPMPGVATWASIAGIAILSTALGFIIFFQIIARSGPSNVMLVTLLVPVSAIALGHVVLGEVITLTECIGAAVIATALLVMDGRLLRWIGLARI